MDNNSIKKPLLMLSHSDTTLQMAQNIQIPNHHLP